MYFNQAHSAGQGNSSVQCTLIRHTRLDKVIVLYSVQCTLIRQTRLDYSTRYTLASHTRLYKVVKCTLTSQTRLDQEIVQGTLILTHSARLGNNTMYFNQAHSAGVGTSTLSTMHFSQPQSAGQGTSKMYFTQPDSAGQGNYQ